MDYVYQFKVIIYVHVHNYDDIVIVEVELKAAISAQRSLGLGRAIVHPRNSGNPPFPQSRAMRINPTTCMCLSTH